MSSRTLPVTTVSAAELRHQLRTPLNHIMGYSEILLEDGPPQEAAARLGAVIAGANAMLQTIQHRLGAEQGSVDAASSSELRSELAPRIEEILSEVRELKKILPPEAASDLRRIESAAKFLADLSPLASNAEPAAVLTLRQSAGASPVAGGRILVVDDNEANRDMLARQLEKQRHEVSTAAGGESALRELRTKKFDIVLLDLMMPGMSGFEVLQTLKRDPALRRIPVILVSALDEMEGVVRSIEAGAEDYLFKPVNPTLLRARIRSTIEKLRAEEAVSRKQRYESIGVLAAGIAHDFNNLLTGIIGHAQLLQAALLVPEDREMAHSIIEAGERAAELTRQLLAYAGKGNFHIEELDLSALVRNTEALIRASLPSRVKLTIRTTRVAPVKADANQIRQAILNLTLNAGEAIPEDGCVTVSTGTAHVLSGERFDVVSDEITPGDYTWVEVRDTGSGMDPAMLENIFEPFFSTKFLGRGLGLAAVAGIVRSHRGMLRVESAEGDGSCFRLFFPAIRAEPALEDGKKSAVLVVDDEAIVRQIVKVALERTGNKVITADSGKAAIDAFRRAPEDIDVVLLDWKMPGMDGLATLREIRRLSPGVKVIVSSGLPRPDAERHFHGEAVTGYLQKPYRMSELTALVESTQSA